MTAKQLMIMTRIIRQSVSNVHKDDVCALVPPTPTTARRTNTLVRMLPYDTNDIGCGWACVELNTHTPRFSSEGGRGAGQPVFL